MQSCTSRGPRDDGRRFSSARASPAALEVRASRPRELTAPARETSRPPAPPCGRRVAPPRRAPRCRIFWPEGGLFHCPPSVFALARRALPSTIRECINIGYSCTSIIRDAPTSTVRECACGLSPIDALACARASSCRIMRESKSIRPPCEKCGRNISVVPSLLTTLVQYWRCQKCGLVWAVPVRAEFIQETLANRVRHRGSRVPHA